MILLQINFRNSQFKYVYEGDNNKAALVAFMQNPTAPPLIKPKEADWASETTSEIVHLTATSFEPALIDEKSVLVMFYAPWCGHCKRMKPEYEKAADIMKEKKVSQLLIIHNFIACTLQVGCNTTISSL